MKHLIVGIVLILAAIIWMMIPSGAQQGGSLVVSVCGTLPQAYAVGSTRAATVNIGGQICV